MDDHLIRTIVVLADDLIWSSRLAEAVKRGGAHPVVLTTSQELGIALEAQDIGDEPALSGIIVDMGARRLDAVAAIERASAARLPVIAVARHDDQVTRKRASAAGARRVFSYDKFFVDGTGIVERWLVAAGATGSSSPTSSAATSASRPSA